MNRYTHITIIDTVMDTLDIILDTLNIVLDTLEQSLLVILKKNKNMFISEQISSDYNTFYKYYTSGNPYYGCCCYHISFQIIIIIIMIIIIYIIIYLKSSIQTSSKDLHSYHVLKISVIMTE